VSTQKTKKINKKLSKFIEKKFYNEKDSILKKQYQQIQLARQKFSEIEETKNTLMDNFGSLQKAIEKMQSFKSDDPATIAMQKIRQSTESFQRVMEQHQQHLATFNPLTRTVRKQKFRRPELTNQIVQSIKVQKKTNTEEVRKKLVNFLQDKTKPEPKKKVEVLADGRKRTHLLYGYNDNGEGSNFTRWLWDNDVLDMFGIVKHYKNKKTRYEPESWEDMNQVLRSLNFTPKEVLEYSIGKIQTKERFLEHRLYRNIEARNASGLEDFIDIYKKHLATKKPFKSFYYSKGLASWCASEDIFFNSEENCRINKDLLVRAWNKKYPAEKIKDKKKK